MATTILIAVPIMALLTVLQVAVLPQLPFLAVTPSFPFLFAMAWSLLNNVEEGMVWAFIGGLFMDIFTIAPAGGLAICYVLAVLAVSLIEDFLPPNRLLVPLVLTALATAVQQLLYMVYLRLFGLTAAMSVSSFLQLVFWQALLVIPIYWALYLIKRTLQPRPVQI
ncbi:MAG: rod shape-determining protein MreD [Candidatus Promineifilaceae bacterium]